MTTRTKEWNMEERGFIRISWGESGSHMDAEHVVVFPVERSVRQTIDEAADRLVALMADTLAAERTKAAR